MGVLQPLLTFGVCAAGACWLATQFVSSKLRILCRKAVEKSFPLCAGADATVTELRFERLALGALSDYILSFGGRGMVVVRILGARAALSVQPSRGAADGGAAEAEPPPPAAGGGGGGGLEEALRWLESTPRDVAPALSRLLPWFDLLRPVLIALGSVEFALEDLAVSVADDPSAAHATLSLGRLSVVLSATGRGLRCLVQLTPGAAPRAPEACLQDRMAGADAGKHTGVSVRRLGALRLAPGRSRLSLAADLPWPSRAPAGRPLLVPSSLSAELSGLRLLLLPTAVPQLHSILRRAQDLASAAPRQSRAARDRVRPGSIAGRRTALRG